MSDQSLVTTAVLKIIAAVEPKYEDVHRHIVDLRQAHPTLTEIGRKVGRSNLLEICI